VARLDARRLTTRKVPVAFTPRHGARPVQTLRRRDQRHEPVRKSSFLLNASGEQIFPAFLQMQEAAAYPQRPRQRPV